MPLAGYLQVTEAPRFPCGLDPVPSYPERLETPAVKYWNPSTLGRDWSPPKCTGWTSTGFSTLVTTSARFRMASGRAGLLRTIGAISELGGTRYWSTTHQRWQTLILEAHALTAPAKGKPRSHFTPEQIGRGGVFYFEQSDNLSGRAVYEMRVREVSDNRIVVAVQNVSIVRFLLLTIFHPADLQTIYFLDRESQEVWRYYGVVRTGINANGVATGKAASAMNRALAYFRWLAGIQTDLEPPAAK